MPKKDNEGETPQGAGKSVLDMMDPKKVALEEDAPEPADDDPEFYQLDPEKVAEDIVINVQEGACILPVYGTHSTKRLYQGDRAKGKYYRNLVRKNNLDSLRLCCKLTQVHLEKLEDIRKERVGLHPVGYVDEHWDGIKKRKK